MFLKAGTLKCARLQFSSPAPPLPPSPDPLVKRGHGQIRFGQMRSNNLAKSGLAKCGCDLGVAVRVPVWPCRDIGPRGRHSKWPSWSLEQSAKRNVLDLVVWANSKMPLSWKANVSGEGEGVATRLSGMLVKIISRRNVGGFGVCPNRCRTHLRSPPERLH